MARKKGNTLGRLRFREVRPGNWECYREGEQPQRAQKEATEAPQTVEGGEEAQPTKRGRKKAADE